MSGNRLLLYGLLQALQGAGDPTLAEELARVLLRIVMSVESATAAEKTNRNRRMPGMTTLAPTGAAA